MSVAEGKNSETGKYDQLYTFGGRGFSIWQVFGPHSRLFDSADQIEKLTAEHCPHLFNRNVTVDDCSDDMVSFDLVSKMYTQIAGLDEMYYDNLTWLLLAAFVNPSRLDEWLLLVVFVNPIITASMTPSK